MFWYDGKLSNDKEISLSINHVGLLYGASVFTTMRIYEGSIDHPLTYFQQHCDRLLYSLQSFSWTLPQWQKIREGTKILSETFSVIRISIFPDGKEWITGRDLPLNLEQYQQEGVMGWISHDPIHRRYAPQYKTGNYLGGWLAYQEAQKLGAKDAILCDESGNWLETTTGNLWGWREGQWYTPGLDDSILPGISRSHWLRVMKLADITVCETLWTPELVMGMSAIAYSNCVVELIPFREIMWGDRRLNLNPNHESIKTLLSLTELMR